MYEVVIVEVKQMLILGMNTELSLAKNTTSDLWRSFRSYAAYQQWNIDEYLDINIYPENYFDSFSPENKFIKWAGISANLVPRSTDLSTLKIPPGKYAKFHYRGLSNDPAVFQYIFQEWLPSSKFKLDNRPHFMILGPKYKNNDPQSEEDIYIPIRKK
ncbi:MAG: GyrI-like domain-containing protein [Crocinitomicaceae bacterium]|jgi:AraC family transcriptional regulator|nr:GyrI-like domain-containing protein [Crocinitomicaceae bacterium]